MSEMSELVRDETATRSLIDEILCVADSKLALGHWYYKVVPNGRSLSDFGALTALTQDELGQTRALWGIVDEMGISAEYLEHARPKGEIHSMKVLDAPPRSWEDFIATAYLVESAMWEMLSTFEGSRFARLSGLVGKIGEEEHFHDLYFRGWIKNRAETEEREYIEAIRLRAPTVLQWFGPPTADGGILLQQGIRSRPPAEARTRFLSRLGQLLAETGLATRVDLGALTAALDWARWVSDQRRPDRDGPPAGLMEFIRPAHPLALLARRPRVRGEG